MVVLLMMANRIQSGETLGAYLRRLRRAAGLTMRELERRSGISNSSISQWETNRHRPEPWNLTPLAGPLGVPKEFLMEALGVVSEAGIPEQVSDPLPLFEDVLQRTPWPQAQREQVLSYVRHVGAAVDMAAHAERARMVDLALRDSPISWSADGRGRLEALARAAQARYREHAVQVWESTWEALPMPPSARGGIEAAYEANTLEDLALALDLPPLH